jgi:secreted Zn-dependent insulinase-like peptidase
LPTGSAFDDIKAEMKQASEERKSELKDAAYMRLAEFGLGMAAGTSPYFAANVGKAGVEALKGYADDLRQKKKLDAEDRKILTDIKRMERADERDNVIKTAEIGTRIFGEMSANARAKLSADVQERIASQEPAALRTARAAMEDPKLAATLKDLNRATTIDPRVKMFMDMPYAEKMQLKATNPTQYAMLEQLASAALLPATVGTPDPSKIRP